MRDLSIAIQTLTNDGDDHVHGPDRFRTSVGMPRVTSASPAVLLDARAEFPERKFQKWTPNFPS